MNKEEIQNKMKDCVEYRDSSIVIDSSTESRTISGLAISTNTKSALIGGMFYETIDTQAVDNQLIKNNDIKLYMNHDESEGTYARSKFGKGSLKLTVTNRGLEFSTEIPKTAQGDAVLEGIRRGDIDAMSFAFIADDEEWSDNDDGTYNRVIRSFKLIDEISLLSCLPAYSQTDVALRSLDKYKNKKLKNKMEETKKVEAEKRADEKKVETKVETKSLVDDKQSKELNDYYDSIASEFDL